ncbi:hypothetical protein HYPBUDRAFT_170192 [Hyphopichia burtonii NRRL Y-1933]|uniref:Uncharacterized protein n=1 Tax=Hyphopichia burtonii NRRL Y-1933 TaxID=984485 RepID=A0A1E4RPZ1_9ASCO|nr:hypothetical protein HYPBUDRAFT_170192 [Hyphopichia burtonii NRRL Y-1933]ODV69353.1 hypothetical protein HYPBUDRAFT_170192 [Hyphopichia burtonii NRRL Y-1933]
MAPATPINQFLQSLTRIGVFPHRNPTNLAMEPISIWHQFPTFTKQSRIARQDSTRTIENLHVFRKKKKIKYKKERYNPNSGSKIKDPFFPEPFCSVSCCFETSCTDHGFATGSHTSRTQNFVLLIKSFAEMRTLSDPKHRYITHRERKKKKKKNRVIMTPLYCVTRNYGILLS